jgi:hypothetical protein
VAEIEKVIRGYFHARDDLEPVSRKELLKRAYCRGPYCVLSYEAVAALRANGLRLAAWKMVSRNGVLRDYLFSRLTIFHSRA